MGFLGAGGAAEIVIALVENELVHFLTGALGAIPAARRRSNT